MSADVIPIREGDAWPDPGLYAGDDAPPLIEAGVYDARVIRAETFDRYFDPTNKGAVPARLVLTFLIMGGPHAGTELPFFVVLPGRHRQTKQRPVSSTSKFYRAWTAANGGPPNRHQRMSLDVFRTHLFSIRVRTVIKDRHRTDLPAAAKHSVVDMILARIA